MNLGEYKVHIAYSPENLGWFVYLMQNTTQGRLFLLPQGKTKLVKQGETYSGDKLYFAILQHEEMQALAQAFADNGIKTKDNSLMEGKLQATEKHLEDMRKLVFEPITEPITVLESNPKKESK